MAFVVPDSLVESGGRVYDGDARVEAFDNTIKVGVNDGTTGQVLTRMADGTASWEDPTGGGGGSQGWDDTLAIDAHTGANNPIVDSGQKIVFAGTGASPSGGDIDAAGDFTIDAAAAIVVQTATSITEISGTTITQQAGTSWSAAAIAGNAQISASGTCKIVTGGVERLEVESTGAWQLGGVVGSAGQVLTSNGAGTPPTWEDGPVGTPPDGINLTATDHIIEVAVTGGGVADWEASFVDMSAGTEGSTTSNNFSSATNTVIAAPGSGVERVVVHANLYCITGGSFTIQKDVGGTDIVLLGPLTLVAGERVEFTAAGGWRVFSAAGFEKTGLVGPTGATGPTGTSANISHSPFTTLTISSNTITIDLSTGGIFTVTLTANVTTVNFSNITTSEANFFTLRVQQDGTGGRAFTNPASWKFGTGSYVVSSGANKLDLLQGITYDDGTTWMVSYIKDYT